jgi:predicted HTH domain antitoxin
MDNLQVRLPDEDLEALDDLAGLLRTSRSDAARTALDEGIRVLRLRLALDRYAAGDITLARAAEDAGVSLQRIALAARDRGIPYFRHGVQELERDIEGARDVVAGRAKRRRGA